MHKPQSIGIIPAREGSKRLPGKNKRLLHGKPLIQWTIEAALNSAAIDTVLVTSDDLQVLEMARTMGVSHVVFRPARLASDAATTVEAVLHALDQIVDSDTLYGPVCLLQPTSPLRTSSDIDAAFELFYLCHRPVVSVCPVECPIEWCNTLVDGNGMSRFVEAMNFEKSERDRVYYRLNGAIYISQQKELLSTRRFVHQNARAYIMPRERSVDIDEEIDFRIAEALARR